MTMALQLLSAPAVEPVTVDEAKAHLAAQGYEPAFGARPLKRLIQREIGDPLAIALLEGTYREGDTVTVAVDGPADNRELVLR